MRVIFAAVLAGLCTAMAVQAQDDCATTPSLVEARELLALHEVGALDVGFRPRGTVYVPVTFHVVRRSDGTGGLPVDRQQQTLANVNAAYAAIGIEFCLIGDVDYIDDDGFYLDIDTIAEINTLRTTNVVPGTINCYFTERLAYENGGLCGISSFTVSPVQGIVMANGCTATATNNSTFIHEFGHYFNLLHTHDTNFGLECVDGSNCAIAGDLICDTPADPRLSNRVNAFCNYTGFMGDPCNDDQYEPQVSNYMSYARSVCRFEYTLQQCDVQLATLVNLRPDLVHMECPSDPCWADWNDDDNVDTNDFVAFLNDYNAVRAGGSFVFRSPDLQGPAGVINSADVLMFVGGYVHGCP